MNDKVGESKRCRKLSIKVVFFSCPSLLFFFTAFSGFGLVMHILPTDLVCSERADPISSTCTRPGFPSFFVLSFPRG